MPGLFLCVPIVPVTTESNYQAEVTGGTKLPLERSGTAGSTRLLTTAHDAPNGKRNLYPFPKEGQERYNPAPQDRSQHADT